MPDRHKVVHAPGQEWLVDQFVERGDVPVTAERVESQACPRGRLYLIDARLLETELDPPAVTFREPDLVRQFRERHLEQTIDDLLKQPVLDKRTLIKIASDT
jgi:hypothetical protein